MAVSQWCVVCVGFGLGLGLGLGLGFGLGFGFGFRLGLGLGLGRLVHEHHGRHDGEMPHTVAATVVEGPWLG